ncbi:MAG: Peptidyl-prolyl cis-trans isomerase, partial [uncultured Solirubrobacteraceae bacterium]
AARARPHRDPARDTGACRLWQGRRADRRHDVDDAGGADRQGCDRDDARAAAQHARRLPRCPGAGARRRPRSAPPQAAPEPQAPPHRARADELRHDRDPPRRAARTEDDRVVCGPGAHRVLRRPDVSPDRQARRQRLRHPGRRSARHRQRRAGLRGRRGAPEEPEVQPLRRGDGQDADRAARHVGQPVLHRDRARGAAAARLRAARQGHRRQVGRAPHRSRADGSRDRDADRPRGDRLGANPVFAAV